VKAPAIRIPSAAPTKPVAIRLASAVRRAAALFLVVAPFAQPASPSHPSLADLPLNELVDIKITTVSKKEQNLRDVAAAVSVLSSDDLRRSSATSAAEALRLSPGLSVAAVNAGDWAISARGFNSQFANKMLVMIDGRTVYSPLFSGVYWDVQQMILEDVERIEVVRGPGSSIWGANAVNGVIQIISKSARDTQGGLLYAGGGEPRQVLAGARYGGRLGEDAWYRVYGLRHESDDFDLAAGGPANDGWSIAKGGFRADSYTANGGRLVWQADAYEGKVNGGEGDINGFNTLARWSRPLSERASYEAQAYFDRTFRSDVILEVLTTTFEAAFQNSFWLGERASVVWGLGYRHVEVDPRKSNTPTFELSVGRIPLDLYSGFIQAEFEIFPETVALTVGTKVERNDFTGLEVQPTARLAYTPGEGQTAWAAVTRGVRTPSVVEGIDFGSFVVGPPEPGPGGQPFAPRIFGNPSLEAETLLAYEIGYRAQPNRRVAIDLAAFYNDYSEVIDFRLAALEPGITFGLAAFQPQNATTAETYGGEAALSFEAADAWQLSASYTLLLSQIAGEAAIEQGRFDLNDPTHQFSLRSSVALGRRLSLDAHLRYVDEVRKAPAYATADLKLSWRPTPETEFSLVGQNLFEKARVEHKSSVGIPLAEIPRGFYAKLKWGY